VSLYPDYRPAGIRKEWEHSSMEETGAGRVMRKYGVPDAWGEPLDAVGWFADDHTNALRVLVADYSNGRRGTLRVKAREWTLTFHTPGPLP